MPKENGAGRRGDVLRVLAAAREPLSINRIATELGVHPNTVRFHLGTLERAGLVEVAPSPPQRPGRPARLYRVRKAIDRGGVRNYRVLAEILLAGLGHAESPAAQAVAVGRVWGRERARDDDRAHGGDDRAHGGDDRAHGDDDRAHDGDDRDDGCDDRGDDRAHGGDDRDGVGGGIDQLRALLDELGFAPEPPSTDHVDLRNCPFLELAEDRARVVCPIHLGLMQGALAEWRAPVTVDRLEPFVEPDRCVAHLAPVRAAA